MPLEKKPDVFEIDEPHIRSGETIEESSPRKSLFVHSLPPSATTDGLIKLFSRSYPLKHATVVSDPSSNLSKGYGFVTFADSSDALAALETFKDAFYEGKKIKVEFAESRSRTSQNSSRTSLKSPGLSLSTARRKVHKGRQQTTSESPPRLIIRNLPWTISTPEDLATLFRCYGKVKDATVPRRGPGLSAGFGFIHLRGRKNAEKAMEEINGKVVDGRTLAVDWAIRKDRWDSLHQSSNDGVAQEDRVLRDSEGSEAALSEFEEGITDEAISENQSIDSVFTGIPIVEKPPDVSLPEVLQSGKTEEDHKPTLFVRNLPFTVTDETLSQQFAFFGPLRYARVVVDPITGRSRGTAFVCFLDEMDAISCLHGAPNLSMTFQQSGKTTALSSFQPSKKSMLEDTNVDSSGRYTMDGRLLQLSRAVDKAEATRLAAVGHTFRDVRDRDKRRLYLLDEGTISRNTALYDKLSPTEVSLRKESARQRQSLIRNNPALQLSLTRLSVRNLPRNITSKDLKALAREAVVGFARDVKGGLRQPLSKEELSRARDLMREAESARKAKGKGIVKQSKVIFEGNAGGKVAEASGAGRSKGYGFIEYSSHRWALMGLRWLNGHAVGIHTKETSKASDLQERKKRLIVEFAIENAQVVGRRQEREAQSQGKHRSTDANTNSVVADGEEHKHVENSTYPSQPIRRDRNKRKRAPEEPIRPIRTGESGITRDSMNTTDRITKKQRVIGRKRMARKARNLV